MLRLGIVFTTVLVLAVTIVGVIRTLTRGWSYGISSNDHVAVLNAVVALAAFVLVAAALVIALLAYIAATGRPNLEPYIFFTSAMRGTHPNELVARVFKDGKLDSSIDWRLTVVLRNRSKYAARNPGVRVDFGHLLATTEWSAGWSIVEDPNFVRMAVHWDGGADYVIHGRWTRTLPQLSLHNAVVVLNPNPIPMYVTIAADGFGPKEFTFRLRLLVEAEYERWRESRVQARRARSD